MISQEKKPNGEILLADPLVWSTSMLHNAHEQSPVPVAIYETANSSSDLVLRSLKTRGRAYRVAYVSDSSAGLELAVTSGLAIGPLYRSDVPPGCRELSVVDGFLSHSSYLAMFLREDVLDSAAGAFGTGDQGRV
ncbi:hypothetical protein NKG99_35000 [Mesorhizobium sp. M1409]